MADLATPRCRSQLTGFIAASCVPPALIGILLLLALRTSSAEARRFGGTAQAMRAEAASLERTVAALVEHDRREPREARRTDHRADGDRRRRASPNCAAIGTGMAEQVGIADDARAQAGRSRDGAQASLGVLLATLPRAHGETRDLAGLLDADRRIAASEHASALDAQLAALAERGREADAVAGGAAQKLAAHLTRMEATSETAGARLEAVTGEMSAAVDALLDRTAEAVDEARKGIAAQGDAMLAMLGANQAALDRAGRDSAEALAARIAAIEEVIDRIAARLGEQRDAERHDHRASSIPGISAGFGTARCASRRRASSAPRRSPRRSARSAVRPTR